jgi:putative ABC transport system permease protein
MAGLVMAWWAIAALRTTVAARVPIPRLETIAIDGRVLVFTLAAALMSALLFGIAPALSSAGSELTGGLKDGGRGSSSARGTRLRNAFVVVEIALALMLLVGAGLLIRSFMTLIAVDPGFDPSHTLTMKVSIPTSKYRNDPQVQSFFTQLFEKLDALPGVKAAGGTSFLPLNGLGAASRSLPPARSPSAMSASLRITISKPCTFPWYVDASSTPGTPAAACGASSSARHSRASTSPARIRLARA